MTAFASLSRRVTAAAGHPLALVVAMTVILAWAVTGPSLGYSDTWLLLINTVTTIITFVMVFVIQNSVNADTRAIQAKLDGIIHGVPDTPDELAGIEKE